MNCFMFPGQPFSNSTAVPDDCDYAHIVALVREQAGFDLVRFSWLREPRGTEQAGLQLLGVAQSLYQLRRLRGHGVFPDLVTQHSMGIYPALVACGSLPEAQAIELTWRVGSCLGSMGKTQRYALGSVIGLELEKVQAVADNNRVYVANHNTSRHFLLSGVLAQMDGALAEALTIGAFSARGFHCDAPLHSPLVAQLEGELAGIFAGYRYAEPDLPLVNHLDQCQLGAGDIPGFLLRELLLPVYWERTYRALKVAGAARFFEVGEGESLRKFNRWIDGEIDKR